MSTEDFEAKFKASDPAHSLENLSADQKVEIVTRALAADAPNVTPISTWTRKKKALSGAAAAVLIGGLIAPSFTGSMVADNRLVFSASSGLSSSAAPEADSRMGSLANDKMSAIYRVNYSFVAGPELRNITQSADAYGLKAPVGFESAIDRLATFFNLGTPKLNEEWRSYQSLSEDNLASFDAWSTESGAYFSYYNQKVSAYFNCYGKERVAMPQSETSDSSSGSAGGSTDSEAPVEVNECQPIVPKNLPSDAEAIAATEELMQVAGVDSNEYTLKAERWDDAGSVYSVQVSALLKVGGVNSPITWWLSFGDNGAIESVSGALSSLESRGTFDLITAAEAIDRANTVNDRRNELWGYPGEVMPMDGDKAATDALVGGPEELAEIVVTVTRIELSLEYAVLEDGEVVWLPSYVFYGYTDEDSSVTPYPYGSIVAIVDSQIDLESLYFNIGANEEPVAIKE
jgi:hypothetical protein